MAILKLIKDGVKNPAYKSVAAYIFTNFFSKGISFLLMPLFTNTKYLTPTDNGLLSLFSSNLMLLSPFIFLGMIQSAGTDFFKKNKQEFSNSFTNSFVISFLLMLFAIVALYLFRDVLQQKFELPPSFVYVIPFLVFLTFCSEQFFILVRNRNEVKNFAVIGIGKAVIEYAVAIVLIVFFFKGWQGRVWGIAISLIVTNLFGAYYYSKNKFINFGITKKHLWDEVKFGIPIIAFNLCVFMLGTTNKLFLAIYNVDKHQLGIYAIACIFGSLVSNLGHSILLYAQPKLYKSLSTGLATDASLKKEFYDFFLMLTFVSIPCVLVVVFLYYFVINKVYFPGIKFFFIVSISSFMWLLDYFLFLYLLYYKEKKEILKISLLSAGFSILINIIMVKNFLILGDALSSLINIIIFGGLVILFTKKSMKKRLGGTDKTITAKEDKIYINNLINQ
jgi:O-antigen/teichoic acid export membrane protein